MPNGDDLNTFLNSLPNLLIATNQVLQSNRDRQFAQDQFTAQKEQRSIENQFVRDERTDRRARRTIEDNRKRMELILRHGLPTDASAADRATFISKVYEGDPIAPKLEAATRPAVLRDEKFDRNIQSGDINVINNLLTGDLSRSQRNRAVTARDLILESGAGGFASTSIEHLIGHPVLGTRAESIIDLSQTNPARAAELAQTLLVDESKIDPEDVIRFAEIREEREKENVRILAGEKEPGKAVEKSRIDEFTKGLAGDISRIGKTIKRPVDIFAEKITGAAERGKVFDLLEDGPEKLAVDLGFGSEELVAAGMDSTAADSAAVLQAGGKIEDKESLMEELRRLAALISGPFGRFGEE